MLWISSFSAVLSQGVQLLGRHSRRMLYPLRPSGSTGQSQDNSRELIALLFRNLRRCGLGFFAGRFAISLTSRLVGRANLFLLLVQIVAALVGPGAGLFARLAGTVFYRVRNVLSNRAKALAR